MRRELLVTATLSIACTMPNPAFDRAGGTEDVGEGDGDPGDGDPGDGDPGDGDPGDGDPGDGDPGDGDPGDGDPGDGDGDGDGEPGCVAPLTDCDGACVDLDTDPSNCGSCGGPCDGVCNGGICEPVGERLVFLSSQPLTGAMGGLDGADGFCTELAASAGIDGTFMAWLSTAQLGPAARMNHFPGPYRLVTGTLVANNWTDLTDGTLAHPIDLDESGQVLSGIGVCEGNEVWTNTKIDGTPRSTKDCGGWLGGDTSTVGQFSAADPSWTEENCDSVSCETPLPIYCVQQ